MKRQFVRLSGHPDREKILANDVHIHLTTHATGLSLCDYSAAEATRILHDRGYTSFVILRNPLLRAVSAYLDKFVLNPRPPGEHGEPPLVTGGPIDSIYHSRREAPDYARSVTFEEFAEYLCRQDDLSLDTHFKSQSASLVGQPIDFLGTVEQMDRLLEWLGRRFGQTVDLEWHNRTAFRKPRWRRSGLHQRLPGYLRERKRLPHATELLTRGLARRLESRYARDFELWKAALAA